MSKDLAKSPYVRYSKRPYQYSSAYQEWHRAALESRGALHRLGREHLEWVEKNVPRPSLEEGLRLKVDSTPKGHRWTETPPEPRAWEWLFPIEP